MNRRERFGIAVAFVLLAVGSFLALTVAQSNLDDHKALDRHACELALTNRKLLRDAVDIFANDPNVKDPTAVAKLDALDAKLAALVASTSQLCAGD